MPEGAVECEGAYVGRTHHDQGIIVGPVVCAESCCMIGYCGEQFNKDEYEVRGDRPVTGWMGKRGFRVFFRSTLCRTVHGA